MDLNLPFVAGAIPMIIFVASTPPMVVKAIEPGTYIRTASATFS